MTSETVIITGACGGIGRELVNEYLSADYQVIAIDSKAKIKELGVADFLQFDLATLVSDDKARSTFKESILSITGKNQIKALINNAAIQTVKSFE